MKNEERKYLSILIRLVLSLPAAYGLSRNNLLLVVQQNYLYQAT